MGTRLGIGGREIDKKKGLNQYTQYILHIKITSRLAPIIILIIARKRKREGERKGERERERTVPLTRLHMRLIIVSEALVTGTWYHQGFWR